VKNQDYIQNSAHIKYGKNYQDFDPLPISEAKLNQQAAALPDCNCLFLQRGEHIFRSQETILASVVQSWISKYL
jgi:hypothetical protein